MPKTQPKAKPKAKAYRSLKEITDDYETICAEAERYFRAEIRPLVLACRTPDEYRDLVGRIALEAADDTGQFRDKPADIQVGMMLAAAARGLLGDDARDRHDRCVADRRSQLRMGYSELMDELYDALQGTDAALRRKIQSVLARPAPEPTPVPAPVQQPAVAKPRTRRPPG